ncbi:hypothetical protein [Lichenicoccus sp.]|uniref:hypothetical protein n=1 Tax=Lichenicoccus sp. TaxID=2781899 RepID=UPI003D121C05
MMRPAIRLAAAIALSAMALPVAALAGDPTSSPGKMSLTPGAGGGMTIVQAAHAQAMRPAPVPDPDIDAPQAGADRLAEESSPTVEPYLFNPRNHFAGDGYEPGSSLENARNNRETPAGGMNVLIPVQ